MQSERGQKKRNKKNWLLIIILICIGVTLAIVSGLGLATELISRSRGQNYYAGFVDGGTQDSGANGTVGSVRENIVYINEKIVTIDPDGEDELSELELKMAEYRSVAWLRCEGTIINYPVMQSGDNDYYLSHLPDGTANKMGSIFLDYRNSPDFTDKNSVIYGHHMKSGDMFTTLKHYNDQAFYEQHPVMSLVTADAEFEIVLFGGYIVDATTEMLPLYFRNATEFTDYLSEIMRRSVFSSNVEVGPDDRIVSLVTCSYEFDNARMLVAGKLVRIDQ